MSSPLRQLLATPSPDAAHEAIRLAVVEALADLKGGAGKTALRAAVDSLRADVTTLRTDLAALAARVDALTARVAVLEPTPTPEVPLAN